MAQVFGQPASPGTASSILGNTTLNALPSPSQPQTVPNDNLKVQYERLLWAAYQVRKTEVDQHRLTDLETCVNFAERVCQELGLKKDEIVQPSGPPGMGAIPPSTSVAPAMGAPQAGAPPNIPSGAPSPGPQGPPLGSPG